MEIIYFTQSRGRINFSTCQLNRYSKRDEKMSGGDAALFLLMMDQIILWVALFEHWQELPVQQMIGLIRFIIDRLCIKRWQRTL